MNKKLLMLILLGLSVVACVSTGSMKSEEDMKKVTQQFAQMSVVSQKRQIECPGGVSKIVVCAQSINFIYKNGMQSGYFCHSDAFEVVDKPADVPLMRCHQDPEYLCRCKDKKKK